MKKIISIVLAIAIIASLAMLAGCGKKDEAKEMKMVWYFPAAHAYGDEVSGYVEQFMADKGVDVKIMIGADWEQATQDNNLRALVADGYNAISVYPTSDGASGLYDELLGQGVNIVGYGASTSAETEQFCVATDVEAALAAPAAEGTVADIVKDAVHDGLERFFAAANLLGGGELALAGLSQDGLEVE